MLLRKSRTKICNNRDIVHIKFFTKTRCHKCFLIIMVLEDGVPVKIYTDVLFQNP